MPGLANRMELNLATAGIFCSIWFFARFAAFFILWRWTGWHYRFSWLICAYWVSLLCFLCILLVPQFHIIIAAQIIFGFCVGLIYYSSLFYSMDQSDTKGEHGGFHEAAIGSGLFTGPTVGATGLYLFPQYPSSGAWAVAGLLTFGLGVIYWVKRTKLME
jgi:MFS family permease